MRGRKRGKPAVPVNNPAEHRQGAVQPVAPAATGKRLVARSRLPTLRRDGTGRTCDGERKAELLQRIESDRDMLINSLRCPRPNPLGVWPLFMNKSGLNSAEASAALSLFLLAVVAPFVLVHGLPEFSGVRWQMALPACVFDALGLIALNSLLSRASGAQAGRAFVVVTVVQIAIPAVYLAVLTGGLTLRSVIGFGAAGIAVYLLR